MANPKLKFYFREPTIDTNIPITDGTVKIDGFDWEFVPNEEACRRLGLRLRRAGARLCEREAAYFDPCFSQPQVSPGLYITSTAKRASRRQKIWKAGGSASCSGTTPPACGRVARCSIITASI